MKIVSKAGKVSKYEERRRKHGENAVNKNKCPKDKKTLQTRKNALYIESPKYILSKCRKYE